MHTCHQVGNGVPTSVCSADARFQNTGLERSGALAEDIAWMQQEYSLEPLEILEDGPGRAYSGYVLLSI